jgi:hypothetical protein
MGEDNLAGELARRLRQRIGQLATEEAIGRGRAIGKAVHFAIEDVYIAAGQIAAQVIERAPVAEPHFENETGPVFDLAESPAQTGMLRLQAVEQDFQARQISHAFFLKT